jgi:N-methylhydantoinase A/oxoprolinase/acetone carboxylase beta subunit
MLGVMEQNIEMMKPNSKPVPIIFVGGGAVLFNQSLKSAAQIVRPQHAGVANAIGAAIAQIGGEAERMLSYRTMSREAALAQVTDEAKKQAIQAGASPDSLRIADIEETAVPYMDDGSKRVRVKVIGDVAAMSALQSSRGL